jgi:hypothetical protein
MFEHKEKMEFEFKLVWIYFWVGIEVICKCEYMLCFQSMSFDVWINK